MKLFQRACYRLRPPLQHPHHPYVLRVHRARYVRPSSSLIKPAPGSRPIVAYNHTTFCVLKVERGGRGREGEGGEGREGREGREEIRQGDKKTLGGEQGRTKTERGQKENTEGIYFFLKPEP